MNDKTLDQRSKELEKKLEHNPIDESVAVLIEGAKKQRKQILVLTISLMLDVLLTIGFGFLSVQTFTNTQATQNNSDVLVAGCESGNDFRKTEAALWNHILSIEPVRSDYTPEQQIARDKTVAEFRKYLETTFAPRDCTKIIEK